MKFKSLQILRGVAAVLVVLFHMNDVTKEYLNASFFDNFFHFGFLGVDIFFVLSGFIITYIHYKDLGAGKAAAVGFYQKRFSRIYPLYWVVATITLAGDFILRNGLVNSIDITLHLNKLPDIIYIAKSYLLIHQKTPFFIGVAWTLAYEILFYLVFGLAIVLSIKAAKMIFVAWCLLIFSSYFFDDIQTVCAFFVPTVILEFLCGCLTAYLLVTGKFNVNIVFLVAGILILSAGVAAYLKYFPDVEERPLGFVILVGLAVSAIIFCCAKAEVKKPNATFNKYLVLIGDASYSIYLTQALFVAATGGAIVRVLKKMQFKIGATALGFVSIVYFLLIVAGGVVTYLLIEKPLLAFVRKIIVTKKVAKPVS